MIDEGKAHEEIHRAELASRILENPLFVEAMDAIKDEIYKDFAQCNPRDERGLLCARLQIGLLDKLLKQLKTHIDTGKLAASALDRLLGR